MRKQCRERGQKEKKNEGFIIPFSQIKTLVVTYRACSSFNTELNIQQSLRFSGQLTQSSEYSCT